MRYAQRGRGYFLLFTEFCMTSKFADIHDWELSFPKILFGLMHKILVYDVFHCHLYYTYNVPLYAICLLETLLRQLQLELLFYRIR